MAEKCPNCGHVKFDTSFTKNAPGCAVPLIVGGIMTVLAWAGFPWAVTMFVPFIIIAIVIGVIQQRKHNKTKLVHYKCSNCKYEASYEKPQ